MVSLVAICSGKHFRHAVCASCYVFVCVQRVKRASALLFCDTIESERERDRWRAKAESSIHPSIQHSNAGKEGSTPHIHLKKMLLRACDIGMCAILFRKCVRSPTAGREIWLRGATNTNPSVQGGKYRRKINIS